MRHLKFGNNISIQFGGHNCSEKYSKVKFMQQHIEQKLVESRLQVKMQRNSNQTGNWTSVLLSSSVSTRLGAIVQHVYIGRKILQETFKF